MNPRHEVHSASGDATRQIVRYRLAIIAIFLLAVFSAGRVTRAWQGDLAPRGVEVESRK